MPCARACADSTFLPSFLLFCFEYLFFSSFFSSTLDDTHPRHALWKGPGGAHHRSMMATDSPEARRHNSCPQYLQLRVRLIFGQDPTPSTVGVYWFAVMPEWMDPLFALLCTWRLRNNWSLCLPPPASRLPPPASRLPVAGMASCPVLSC